MLSSTRSGRRRFAFKTVGGGTVTVSVKTGQSSRLALAEQYRNYTELCAVLGIEPEYIPGKEASYA